MVLKTELHKESKNWSTLPITIFLKNYNNFPGMKRGQSPVVPFFRGGEGDGTFNGFVLSSFEPYMARAWLFSVPRNCQNLSFLGSRYKGSEKVPPTMQQHCIALWRQWCVAAPNNLQVKWGPNLYEFENKIEFLTFWSSKLASSFRSNWTDIWSSNSNGSWTDKHSSQFSTAKEMSVKATFFI